MAKKKKSGKQQMKRLALKTEDRLCELLRKEMKKRGISKAEFAKRLAHETNAEWTQRRVWKLLTGRMVITTTLLAKVLRALDTTLLDFYIQEHLQLNQPDPTLWSTLQQLCGEDPIKRMVVLTYLCTHPKSPQPV
jgi:transcriptional regulator with XRE-family HTH domain